MNKSSLVLPIAVLLLAGCVPPAPPDNGVVSAAPESPVLSPSPAEAALTDSGARLGACGTFTLNEDGTGTYVVVEDDVAGVIAERFGLESLGQLINEGGQRVGDNIPIFANEVLTLQPNR